MANVDAEREPRRFGCRDRGGRGWRQTRREMAPQRLEKIEFGPGNGRVSEASNPLHIVHGRAADRARLRLTRRNNDKDSGVGQSCRKRKKVPKPLKTFDAKLKKAAARQAASQHLYSAATTPSRSAAAPVSNWSLASR